MAEFQVKKEDPTQTRIVENAGVSLDAPIKEGEIIVKVDMFSFTANNVTYGVVGEKIGYWQFFPPVCDDPKGWGLLPVWGFADVVQSKADGVAVGERLFGYFPPATALKMKPVAVKEAGFIDGVDHRSKLPAGYNMYRRVDAEFGYNQSMDKARALLYPLFITSFSLGDFLVDNDWFGADQVIIISASSKTSIGLAYAVNNQVSDKHLVGLTSKGNAKFVESLGLYHETITYDDMAGVDVSKPSVIVDMSGNGAVLGALHSHLGDNMKYCSNVGVTHWDQNAMAEGFIQERSAMFFAPGHIQKRLKDWGPGVFEQKSSAFMADTAAKATSWLRFKDVDGVAGLASIYDDVCNGRAAPAEGIIIHL